MIGQFFGYPLMTFWQESVIKCNTTLIDFEEADKTGGFRQEAKLPASIMTLSSYQLS